MTHRRHILLAASLAATLSLAGPAALAQGDYPSRTIVLVNPYAAGGPADALARTLGEQLAARLKQTVVVENRAGGAATLGTGYVARAKPDGYTLLIGTSAGHVVTPLMQRVAYDGIADFAFIGVVASQPNVLLVNTKSGVDSVAALIERAKASPGTLNYASAGNGGATHLGAEMFLQRAGIRATHVPYGGAAPALNDLIAGHVEMAMLNLAAARPHVEQGRIKALAYGGTKRSPLLPNTPTLAEVGMGGAELATWYTLAVPKGTPQDVVAKLGEALAEVQRDAAWQQFVTAQGAEQMALSPKQTTDFVSADRAAMTKLLGTLGLLHK